MLINRYVWTVDYTKAGVNYWGSVPAAFAKQLRSFHLPVSHVKLSLIEMKHFHDRCHSNRLLQLQLVGPHASLCPYAWCGRDATKRSRKGAHVYFSLSSLQHNASRFPGGIMVQCSWCCWVWISFHCRYSGRGLLLPCSSLSTDPITAQPLTNK